MNNVYSFSLNGGGNSLNIIRIPSVNEAKNIISSSDLNGSITPSDVNTWHWIIDYYWWAQNNSNNAAYIIGLRDDGITSESVCNKNDTLNYGGWREPYCFLPVIEYRE